MAGLFDSSFRSVSSWLTFFLQVTFAYGIAWILCALVQSPRSRVRLWNWFLAGISAAWIAKIFAAGPVISAQPSSLQPGVVGLNLVWPLTRASALPVLVTQTWFPRLYLAVVLMLCLRLIARRLRLRLLLQDVVPASGETQELFQALCREIKVKRCRLKLVHNLRSPGTAGWLRPCVFVPAELLPRLRRSHLCDVLNHELFHVKHRDYLWDQMATLACSFLWFHPTVWLARKHLRWERELACDEAVVAGRGDERCDYAECLTKLASWWFLQDRRTPGGIAFSSAPSLLATRVRALLREPSPSSTAKKALRGAGAGLVTTGAAVLLPSIALHLYLLAPLPGVVTPLRQTSRYPATARVRLPLLRPPTATQKVVPADAAAPANTKDFAPILALSSSPRMPVLVNSASPTSNDSQPQGRPAPAYGDSSPAWDEGGARGRPSRPTWTDVANTAIRVGVAITQLPDRDGEGAER